jgi:hypothetical protein
VKTIGSTSTRPTATINPAADSGTARKPFHTHRGTQHPAAVIPGFEHFNGKYITPGKVTFDTLFCRSISSFITETNGYHETITDQPIQLIGIEDFIPVFDLPENRVTDYPKACCRYRSGGLVIDTAIGTITTR